MAALVARARRLGLRVLEAEALSDDRFLIGLLARIGPITVSFSYGGYSVCVDLERAGPKDPSRRERDGFGHRVGSLFADA